MSQGDMERKTGLLRCYISRVENGHTIPAIETMEKMAQALNMQLYRLMYDGNNPRSCQTPMLMVGVQSARTAATSLSCLAICQEWMTETGCYCWNLQRAWLDGRDKRLGHISWRRNMEQTQGVALNELDQNVIKMSEQEREREKEFWRKKKKPA